MAKFAINMLPLWFFVVGLTCISAAPTPQTPITRPTDTPTTIAPLNSTTTSTSAPAFTTTTTEPTTSTTQPPAAQSTTTVAEDIAADIADLFVANQDFGGIEALQAEAADDEEATTGTSTSSEDDPASVTSTTTTPSSTNTPATSNINAAVYISTVEPISAQPAEDSTELDDALFDVIIDDGSSSSSATATDSRPVGSTRSALDNTAAERTSDIDTEETTRRGPSAEARPRQVLEVDSEEFFVPADIKEREPTTLTTTAVPNEATDGPNAAAAAVVTFASLSPSSETPGMTVADETTVTESPAPADISTTTATTATTATTTTTTTTTAATEIAINPDTSDTVFYISNTEVKVRESPPDSNVPQPPESPNIPLSPNAPPQSSAVVPPVNPPPPRQPANGTKPNKPATNQQTNEELQFFPASYDEDVIIDVRRENSTLWHSGVGPDRYEEDLIISQTKQQLPQQPQQPRKPQQQQLPLELEQSRIIANDNDGDLSISYVGESYIEVKEFARDDFGTVAPSLQQLPSPGGATSATSSGNNFAEYVIIEPIVEAPQSPAATSTAEPPIGVPVIEELPPALIRQYTAGGSGVAETPRRDVVVDLLNDNNDDSNAEQLEDNEILPPLPPALRPRARIPALIQNPDNGAVGQERHRLVNEAPADEATAAIVVLDNGGPGGEKATATFVLSDWLNGMFGKGLPAKRHHNNNNHGNAAAAIGAAAAAQVADGNDGKAAPQNVTASAVSLSSAAMTHGLHAHGNGNGSASNATDGNETRGAVAGVAESPWKGERRFFDRLGGKCNDAAS